MRRYTIPIAVAALVCALLLASVVVAQSGGGSDLSPRYVVVRGAASGGGYRLASTTWQASGVSSGGGYRLAGPASPTGTGNQCCCTFLPCVVRNH